MECRTCFKGVKKIDLGILNPIKESLFTLSILRVNMLESMCDPNKYFNEETEDDDKIKIYYKIAIDKYLDELCNIKLIYLSIAKELNIYDEIFIELDPSDHFYHIYTCGMSV